MAFLALANHAVTTRHLLTRFVRWHVQRAVCAHLCALLKGQQDVRGALCFPPIGSWSFSASALRGTELPYLKQCLMLAGPTVMC